MTAPYFADDAATLYLGDARDVLPTLPDASVDCVVTSPPYYGLRDYGNDRQIGLESTPGEYVDELLGVLGEVHRVLVDDGTLWLNLGDSYAGKANGGDTYDRHRGTGHRSKQGIVPRRINNTAHAPYKSLLGIPWRVALGLIDAGWTLRNAVVWHKPNAMPESVADRLSCRYETVYLFTKGPRYLFDLDAIREPHTREWDVGNNGGRRMSSGSSYDRGDHLNAGLADAAPHPKGRNPGDVWTIATQPFAGAHFAVMPRDLARRCITAGCRPGGVVLDPFSGSGTTGAAAAALGRRYIGIDVNREYLDLSLATRLAQTALIGVNP